LSRKLKCPVCGSLLRREGKAGCACTNPESKVIKAIFDRNLKIKVISEGIDFLPMLGRGKK
jgi:hypothetical protein